MKKILFLLFSFCFFTSSFAAFEVKPAAEKATNMFLPIGKGVKISLMDLSKISIKDFEKLTGKHLDFIDRIGFKIGQRKLRKNMNSDGTIKNKSLLNFRDDDGDVSTFDKIGWLIKGLLLGPLAVILAYIFLKDENRELIKWAWFGFIGFVIIGALYLLEFA